MSQSARFSPRTGRNAGGFTTGAGWVLVGVGALCLSAGIATAAGGDEIVEVVIAVAVALVGAALLAVGVLLTISGRAKQRKAAWIRSHGVALTARVVDAQHTGMAEGDVPIYRLSLELNGPDGPYTVTTNRIIPEHEVGLLLHKEVRVRAHPVNRLEVVIEDQS